MPTKIKKKKNLLVNPNINLISEHRFVHGNYKIIWEKPKHCDGECSDPKDRRMWLNPELKGKKLLKICLDEAVHACNFTIDNDHVYDMSDAIADFLYRLGFRLEKKK